MLSAGGAVKQKKHRVTPETTNSKKTGRVLPKNQPNQEQMPAIFSDEGDVTAVDQILSLQQMVGNEVVSRMLSQLTHKQLAISRRSVSDIQRYEAYEHAKFGDADKSAKKIVKIKGVKFTYGEVMALGDLFAKPEDMYAAPVSELKQLRKLIRQEAKDPSSVKAEDWQKATGDRYIKLAEKNVPHFGPSRADIAPKSKGSGGDFKSEWEKHHRKALLLAQKNEKDKALGINAFADHFLTDSFASGHIFNKEDVMKMLKSALSDKKVMENFFEKVAIVAWQDNTVSELLSKHETVEWKGIIFRPNINSPSRFGKLLQGIYESPEGQPTLLNSAAAMVHDELNKTGIEVENAKGEKWHLSGDKSVNEESLKFGRQAVAQSQLNVINAVGKTGDLDFEKLFKAVWSNTPQPTAKATKGMQETIKILTDPSKLESISAAAMIIKNEIKTLVKELVKRKHLKVA